MAGIGFEIKKIYDKNTFSNKVFGLFYTSFVTVGPTAICILMLLAIRKITKFYGISFMERELLTSAILYAFVFSLLFVSGTVMVLSRYLSDAIYNQQVDEVFASLAGALTVTAFVSGTLGILFYIRSPLPNDFKLLAYTMYMELSMISVLMVYISAIKDYKRVSIAYTIGVLTALVLSLVWIHFFHAEVVNAILCGIDIGFFISIVLILKELNLVVDFKGKNHFAFLRSFGEHPQLFFINGFYTLGLFIHNLIFWLYSDLAIEVGDTYRSAPDYDMASFYGILTILPAAVFFVLKVETSFYVKYKSFLMTIVSGGSLKDLKKAKSNMCFLIQEEMSFIMELQLLLTVLSTVILKELVFPYYGLGSKVSELFVFFSFGYYACFMAFLLTTVLLYFDAQREAMYIQLVFFVSNILLSLVTIWLGEAFWGLGLALSGIVTLCVALYYFNKILKDIDYIIFSKQPLTNQKKLKKRTSLWNTFLKPIIGELKHE